MAVTFEIKPKEGEKITLTIPQIAELMDLHYGTMDKNFCLQKGEIGPLTVMYSPHRIGRGFEVWVEDNTVFIRMPIPTTEGDIRLAYALAHKICQLFGTDSFICNSQIVPFEHIGVKIETDIAISEDAIKAVENQLENSSHKGIILFAALNPVTIGKEELAQMGGTLAGFEELLDRLQQMDVHYSSPKFFQLKNTGDIIGIFFVGEERLTVLPKMPVSLSGQIENLKGYYVHIPDNNDIPFMDFMANAVPVGDYDSGHSIYCLTEKNISFMAQNLAVETHSGKRITGSYWGKTLDDGRSHMGKIRRLELNVPESAALQHMAVFIRWAAEKNLLSEKLEKFIPDITRLATDPHTNLTQLIAGHPAFDARLRTHHFKRSAQGFVKRFYKFGDTGFPACVDAYTEKVMGTERYNCEEYKNEAYLFMPYDEAYYKNISAEIEKAWKKYNR